LYYYLLSDLGSLSVQCLILHWVVSCRLALHFFYEGSRLIDKVVGTGGGLLCVAIHES
jgi:hypothetical protein